MIGTRNVRSYLAHMVPNYTAATVLGCYKIRCSSKRGSSARQPRSAQAYTSQVPSPCDSLSHCDTLGAAPRSALGLFGLWRMYFPPVLIRTDRRLLVEVLSEGESWLPVCSTRARATKQLGDFAHAPRVCFPGPWQRTAQGHFDVTCKPGRARERETLLGKHCP